jgi:hypothetical protein
MITRPPTSVFLEKTFQLYEMILVRHGLMIVGYSYGAKTSMWKMLAAALGDLNAQGLLEVGRSPGTSTAHDPFSESICFQTRSL